MENESRFNRSERVSDKVLEQINTSELNGYDIARGIKGLMSPLEPFIGLASVYRSIASLAQGGMIDFTRKMIIMGDQTKLVAHWRLTDRGAQAAHDRGLITEEDLLRIIHQREQDPNLHPHTD